MRMQVLKFLLISDSSENFQHYDLLQFITSPPSEQLRVELTTNITVFCFVPFYIKFATVFDRYNFYQEFDPSSG